MRAAAGCCCCPLLAATRLVRPRPRKQNPPLCRLTFVPPVCMLRETRHPSTPSHPAQRAVTCPSSRPARVLQVLCRTVPPSPTESRQDQTSRILRAFACAGQCWFAVQKPPWKRLPAVAVRPAHVIVAAALSLPLACLNWLVRHSIATRLASCMCSRFHPPHPPCETSLQVPWLHKDAGCVPQTPPVHWADGSSKQHARVSWPESRRGIVHKRKPSFLCPRVHNRPVLGDLLSSSSRADGFTAPTDTLSGTRWSIARTAVPAGRLLPCRTMHWARPRGAHWW